MGALSYHNLDRTDSFRKLKALRPRPRLRDLLEPERVRSCSIPAGGGLVYNYAAKSVNGDIVGLLQELAFEQELVDKYRALVNGAVMNTGEQRMVLHHLCRGQLGREILAGGKDLRRFYVEQQERISAFAEKVHAGEVRGSTGKPFMYVVQVGIGGSDLGPRALYLALERFAREEHDGPRMEARFISNVDPDEPNDVLNRLDLEATLFVLVSKSGTTQETLTNAAFVREKMADSGAGGLDPGKHMVAVTGEDSPLAREEGFLDVFFIDNFIGGRYSSSSAVGGTLLTLSFGRGVFENFLEGAHEADRLGLEPDLTRNAALMDALIGIYERNVLGYPVTAVLPYSQALNRFPAHLQQLDMESNGKRVNRFGEPVSYATGPVVYGEPGTNGQHSFYQLLHQGTDTIPLQFIGFKRPQHRFDVEFSGSSSQMKLNANLAAQIVAFAKGKADENPNRHFPGERPSSLIRGERLTPKSLGALLAHFENKVMFQGFAWNINSFDQEGVQLGKSLTRQALEARDMDPALRKYAELLGVR